MSRTLKRVPVDFEWPLNQQWSGYENPYSDRCTECQQCEGSGSSPQARMFHDQWYGSAEFDPTTYGVLPCTPEEPGIVAIATRNLESAPEFYGSGDLAMRSEKHRLWRLMRGQWCHHLNQQDVDALVAEGRLWDFTRTPRTEEQRETVRQKVAGGENSWLPEDNGYRPTYQEVNEWSFRGFGHDSINCWIVVRARCEREGVEPSCQHCGGEGCLWANPQDKINNEQWEPTEPPTGEGYQLWEGTEYPRSPVFTTLEELCGWCADNATVFGHSKASAERWHEMLAQDFVHLREGNNIFMG